MKWKLLLGLVLSALFLYLAFRRARLQEVLDALNTASYWLMIPATILTFVAYALRAVRWHYLLRTVKPISFHPLFSSIMIGFMGNNVLPARLGELLRAHSLGRTVQVSRSAALASIVVERICDIFVLLSLFGAIIVLRGLPGEIHGWGVLLLCLVVPVLAALILFQMRPRLLFALCERIPHAVLRGRVLHAAGNFHEALGVLRETRSILLALFYSVAMWACIATVVICCVVALHLRIPLQASVVVLVVMAIGTMIPSAPGYIGTLQYSGVLALSAYGVERSVALSFTLLFHATQWFPVTIVGLIYFLRERLALGSAPGAEPGRAEGGEGGDGA